MNEALTPNKRSFCNEEYYRKSQQVKMQRIIDQRVPSPNRYIYNITSAPKVQRTLQKRKKLDCKSKRTRKSSVRFFFLL